MGVFFLYYACNHLPFLYHSQFAVKNNITVSLKVSTINRLFALPMTQVSSKLNGLIQLLDDPDESIYAQISDQFDIIGIAAVPLLEKYWEESDNPLAVERATFLINRLNNKSILDQIQNWVDLGCKNLLQGTLLVAKLKYPDLNEDKITNFFNQVKQDIWIELNDNLTAMEKIAVVNKVMFTIHSFEGNREDYYDSKNSFINKAITNKTGTPLTIGVIYAIICQGLDIPVYGVNLPHHFVLAYQDDQSLPIMQDDMAEPGILFYINPFNNGSIFGKREVTDFLVQNKVSPDKKHFVPCSNKQIIKRMINNIIVAFEKEKKEDNMNTFKDLLAVFNK